MSIHPPSRFILCLNLFFFAGIIVPLLAQPAVQKKNVLDYYLLLPGEYFLCDAVEDNDSPEFRESVLEHRNIRNGYLRARPQGFYTLEVALFKYEGKDIIAVNIPCGPGCMCNALDFFSWSESGGFTPLDLLPGQEETDNLYEDPVLYQLPEFGTSITAIPFDGESDEVVFFLDFKEGKFVLREE